MRKRFLSVAMVALAAVLAKPEPAAAQGIALVRDAEIENTIRAYATPIFDAAGLDTESIGLHIVNATEINAFVAAGQNLFITIGLLLAAQNANQVVGVIAHESGHIAGGHLARREQEMRNAQIQSIVSMVLGAAVMAAGAPAPGQAVLTGGQQVAQRQLLAYSREHESAADQAAVTYLARAGESPRGLMEFLTLLATKERTIGGGPDPYVLTHPVTTDRIEFVRNQLAHSPYADAPDPPGFDEMFARMQAKLVGFMRPQAETASRYPDSDQSLAARYARAIAYYRRPDLAQALPLIDGLIAERPRDPYFQELKGQMLYENGHVREAVGPYQVAVDLLPDSALLRVGLAQAQLETNDPALNAAALANLQEAIALERDFPMAWGRLAVAYGRGGNVGLAALALAEKAMLLGDVKEAGGQAARAERLLAPDSAGWLRAQDIKREIANRKQ